MKLALGWKTHSGWAVLIAAGLYKNELVIVDRRRVELIDEPWQKQPYHAAEKLESGQAGALVEDGIASVRQIALRELRAAIERETVRGNQVSTCTVLVGKGMPDWSIEEILAVHMRMHKAEGVLYQDALIRAARICDLRLCEVTANHLAQLSTQENIKNGYLQQIALAGKELGPPWGRDQKDAALGALIALRRY